MLKPFLGITFRNHPEYNLPVSEVRIGNMQCTAGRFMRIRAHKKLIVLHVHVSTHKKLVVRCAHNMRKQNDILCYRRHVITPKFIPALVTSIITY